MMFMHQYSKYDEFTMSFRWVIDDANLGVLLRIYIMQNDAQDDWNLAKDFFWHVDWTWW